MMRKVRETLREVWEGKGVVLWMTLGNLFMAGTYRDNPAQKTGATIIVIITCGGLQAGGNVCSLVTIDFNFVFAFHWLRKRREFCQQLVSEVVQN